MTSSPQDTYILQQKRPGCSVLRIKYRKMRLVICAMLEVFWVGVGMEGKGKVLPIEFAGESEFESLPVFVPSHKGTKGAKTRACSGTESRHRSAMGVRAFRVLNSTLRRFHGV
jgi:hypothetical protein